MDQNQLRNHMLGTVDSYLRTIDTHVGMLSHHAHQQRESIDYLTARLAQAEVAIQALLAKVTVSEEDEALRLATRLYEDPTFNFVAVNGVPLILRESTGSWQEGTESGFQRVLAQELRNGAYRLDSIPFEAGDFVVDVGANIGIVSIYLAKRRPDLRILAYEPNPISFADLTFNLQMNQIGNVMPFNLAVTGDGRDCALMVPTFTRQHNIGGSSIWVPEAAQPGEAITVQSTTLDGVFAEHGIKMCRLLKLDCEGSEHEILGKTAVLSRVHTIGIELHENEQLRQAGYSNAATEALIQQHFAPEKQWIQKIGIPG